MSTREMAERGGRGPNNYMIVLKQDGRGVFTVIIKQRQEERGLSGAN